MNTKSSEKLSPFWKGVAAGVGGMLLLLAIFTGVMHYGMETCPFCGQSISSNSDSASSQPESPATEDD